MKVGILTHYGVNNQGAQLQMYALNQQLKDLGYTPVILTYNKNFDFERSQKLRNEISIHSIPYILKNFLLKKGFRLTFHNMKKYLINKRFRENNFCFEFYSDSDCNAVVIGSDQVFDVDVGINIMMFGFGLNTKNLITYAPCFGKTDPSSLASKNLDNLVKSGLEKISHVSVRDRHSQKVLKELCERTVPIVCDPALLYTFTKELEMVKIKPISKKYLIAYSYDRRFIDKNEVTAIKKFAKRNNLITVSVGTYHKWCDKNIACDCLDWIAYFKNAECIITDTFHGTIASIIGQKPFAVIVRQNGNKMLDLLRVTSSEERLLNDLTIEELNRVFSKAMCWDKINQSVKEIRTFSLNFLQSALEDMENS